MKTYKIAGTDSGIEIESRKRPDKPENNADPTDSGYEDKIVALLGEINGTTVGQLLLGAIGRCAGKAVLIRKYFADLKWSYDEVCAVVTLPKDGGAIAKRQSVQEGRSVKGDRRNEDPKNEYYFESWSLGTGEGTDVKITFTPGLWAETDGFCRKPGSKLSGPGSTADAVLFHELVHALRHLTGTRLEYPLTVDGHPGQKWEEFVAILVTNIFMSARSSTQLRSFNHDVIDTLAEPEKFMKRNGNRKLVDDLCEPGRFKPFLNDLAMVSCAFNPIRELLFGIGDYAARSGAFA